MMRSEGWTCKNDLWIPTILTTTLSFVSCGAQSGRRPGEVFKRHLPAKAVTDLPPWTMATIKHSSGLVGGVYVP
jgi:hypothetical protein